MSLSKRLFIGSFSKTRDEIRQVILYPTTHIDIELLFNFFQTYFHFLFSTTENYHHCDLRVIIPITYYSNGLWLDVTMSFTAIVRTPHDIQQYQYILPVIFIFVYHDFRETSIYLRHTYCHEKQCLGKPHSLTVFILIVSLK